MIRRPIVALLLLTGMLLLLAGCGSSSKSDSNSQSISITSTPPSSTTSSSQTSSTPSPAPDASTVKAATEECKRIIKSESKLSDSAKEKLEGACAEAAKGNTSVVKKVAQEVCEETINSSSIPQSAKEEALATCKKT